MSKLRVRITQQDIEQGERTNPLKCPAALAINRERRGGRVVQFLRRIVGLPEPAPVAVFPIKGVFVYYPGVEETKIAETPRELANWIADFDCRRLTPTPIEFELELVEPDPLESYA